MATKKYHVRDYSGRITFEFILEQVYQCISDLTPFFRDMTADKIFTDEYLSKCLKIQKERPQLDLVQIALCDISYSIVFFGVTYWDFTSLLRLYEKYFHGLFLNYIAFYISKKPHLDANEKQQTWAGFKSLHLPELLEHLNKDYAEGKNQIPNYRLAETEFHKFLEKNKGSNIINSLSHRDFYKYYGGHQFKLGHYYRHLFQSVKYINENKILSFSEKYNYIKILRAQLSTPEQYLLFFNSISIAGRAWEFDQISDNLYENVNCYFISKFNLIKNIPDTFILNAIQIRYYYPLVHFEFIDEPAERRKIENKFY